MLTEGAEEMEEEWGRGESERKEKRGRFQKMCERKTREENERWERKVAEIKRESEIWEIVNSGRRMGEVRGKDEEENGVGVGEEK